MVKINYPANLILNTVLGTAAFLPATVPDIHDAFHSAGVRSLWISVPFCRRPVSVDIRLSGRPFPDFLTEVRKEVLRRSDTADISPERRSPPSLHSCEGSPYP